MATRYHRAARDGSLTILKEATRRDCNDPDDDGLTPTQLCAYEGHLDALRVVCGRGGDPDKCDHYGNTALHCAAARGHLSCVSFLINFGANIWALDNEFHSAKDLAAINDKEEILRYIDVEGAEQGKADPKKTKKLQDKAKKDSEKRQKEFLKRQKKSDKKREEEEVRIKKELAKINDKDMPVQITQNKNPLLRLPIRKPEKTKQNSTKFSDLTRNQINNRTSISGIKKIVLKKKVSNSSDNRHDFKMRLTNENNTQYMQSLSGLRRDSEILFVPNAHSTAMSGVGRRGKIEDVFNTDLNDTLERTKSVPDFLEYRGSLFDRPGFGSVAFRSTMTAALRDIPTNSMDSLENTYEEIKTSSEGSTYNSSIPWQEEDLPSDEESVGSPLYMFLASHRLQHYLAMLTAEHVDMDSVILLTEKDLIAMNMPLGPRRKLLKAIEDRKQATESEIYDIRL